MQVFLELGDNKTDLAKSLTLLDECIAQAAAHTTIVVSGGCSQLKVIFLSGPTLDVAVLKSNHEEADSKFCSFVLHVIISNNITGISTLFCARHTFQKRCIGTLRGQDEG